MQYYPAKILIHFKSSKVKIAINNKYIINYKIKSKNNASLVFDNRYPVLFLDFFVNDESRLANACN